MQFFLAPGTQRHCGAIECDLVVGLNMISELLLDLRLGDRCGQKDTPVRRRAGQLSHRDVRRFRQCRRLFHTRAAPVGQHERSVTAIACNTIRKGEREHEARG